ncbi:MAG: 3-oxoacyl-ACP synthase III family protein [Paludibacter sp.]
MAFQEFKTVKIDGVAACVPANIEENAGLDLFASSDEYEKFVATTGIERRHVVTEGVCASDLCLAAAEKLINELNWDRNDIECLIFVSQTPDYKLPATSCVLHGKLGLSKNCMTFDISMGCSGWVYGISTMASIVSSGSIKKGLLLVGDTVTRTKSPLDKSTYPLFGDAGTATALSYNENASPLQIALFTDGLNYDAIMIEDGGYRNPVTEKSFEYVDYGNGIVRNKLQSVLDGSSVFTFGISKAPQSVNALIEHFSIDKDEVDYFVFHQANMLMNEKIRTKLKLPEEKVPYILKDFGNTSSTSIPLTLVNNIGEKFNNSEVKILACAFGVGLSWGVVYTNFSTITCCKLIEV